MTDIFDPELGELFAKQIRDKYRKSDFDVDVCEADDCPEDDDLISTGITFLLQQDPQRRGQLLEIRGYDTSGKPFSCKFRMRKMQPVAMRAVSAYGYVNRLECKQVPLEGEFLDRNFLKKGVSSFERKGKSDASGV